MAVLDNKLKTKSVRKDDSMMPFTKENYILLVIGIVIILTAYVLMAVDNQGRWLDQSLPGTLHVGIWICRIGFCHYVQQRG